MEIEITTGEFFDRFTILINKIYYCKDKNDVVISINELIKLSKCFEEIKPAGLKQISADLKKLRDINKELWQLEEIARTDMSAYDPMKVWKSIREQNKERNLIKNNISKVFMEEREVKDYTTTQDS